MKENEGGGKPREIKGKKANEREKEKGPILYGWEKYNKKERPTTKIEKGAGINEMLAAKQ